MRHIISREIFPTKPRQQRILPIQNLVLLNSNGFKLNAIFKDTIVIENVGVLSSRILMQITAWIEKLNEIICFKSQILRFFIRFRGAETILLLGYVLEILT